MCGGCPLRAAATPRVVSPPGAPAALIAEVLRRPPRPLPDSVTEALLSLDRQRVGQNAPRED
jgi:hypothetical protein